jgi:hypothetical protein
MSSVATLHARLDALRASLASACAHSDALAAQVAEVERLVDGAAARHAAWDAHLVSMLEADTRRSAEVARKQETLAAALGIRPRGAATLLWRAAGHVALFLTLVLSLLFVSPYSAARRWSERRVSAAAADAARRAAADAARRAAAVPRPRPAASTSRTPTANAQPARQPQAPEGGRVEPGPKSAHSSCGTAPLRQRAAGAGAGGAIQAAAVRVAADDAVGSPRGNSLNSDCPGRPHDTGIVNRGRRRRAVSDERPAAQAGGTERWEDRDDRGDQRAGGADGGGGSGASGGEEEPSAGRRKLSWADRGYLLGADTSFASENSSDFWETFD